MIADTANLGLLRPAARRDRPLCDLLGRFTATRVDAATLQLRAQLAAGLYRLDLATQDGSFATETTMVMLTEWPTMRTVPCGPFDLDHTTYEMAVPTFEVTVNGVEMGLVWCEVPSPEDVERRRISATWAVRVPVSGDCVIGLTVPARDRDRLRWSDLDYLAIRADDRQSVRLLRSPPAAHPRLCATAADFQRLRSAPDEVEQALLCAVKRRLDSGENDSYTNRAVLLACHGLVAADADAIEAAIAIAVGHCQDDNWGYNHNRGQMGWNSDRDAGMRMYEVAMVYDWLHQRLTPAQRQQLRTGLAQHAEIAWQITQLQRNYWYYRTCEAHGHGYWFGFAAAAGALLGDDPRAETWLDWIHGNHLDSLKHLPDDGIVEWSAFNAQWAVATAMILESLRGAKLPGKQPFLRGFADNFLRYTGHSGSPLIRALLFYLARRYRHRRCQADALQLNASKAHADPLALFAYDASLYPGRPTKLPPAMVSLGGSVVCRTSHPQAVFRFGAGTPLTPAKHEAHNWINRAWCREGYMGSFSWTIDRKSVIPATIRGYRARTSDGNLITVDNLGSHDEGRWLGHCLPLTAVAFIEHFGTALGTTCCVANLTPAYAPQLEVVSAVRCWLWHHDTGVLVMRDTMTTAQPRRFAWHLHTVGRWRRLADNFYRTPGAELAARVLHSSAAIRATTAVVHWVPSYTYGLNGYKTMDWQREFRPSTPTVPEFVDLQFRPRQRVQHWQLVTVLGPPEAIAAATSTAGGGGITVHLDSDRAVRWPGCGPESELVTSAGSAVFPFTPPGD